MRNISRDRVKLCTRRECHIFFFNIFERALFTASDFISVPLTDSMDNNSRTMHSSTVRARGGALDFCIARSDVASSAPLMDCDVFTGGAKSSGP